MPVLSLPPLWRREYAWVQSYIYIGLKLAALFSATPPYALFLAWDCTHSRTGKAGHARGLNGLHARALLDTAAQADQQAPLYSLFIHHCALHIIRVMHVYPYIVPVSPSFIQLFELLQKSERNKMDIWWR